MKALVRIHEMFPFFSTVFSVSSWCVLSLLLLLLILSSSWEDMEVWALATPILWGSALTYSPHVIKHVVKEIEVPVKTITYRIKETGCKNLAEGEARRKRSADEAAEVKSATVLTYAAGVPFG